MNIFDLGEIYIDAIPEGNKDLQKEHEINMVTLKNGEIQYIRYRGYSGKMAKKDLYNSYGEKPKLGYFDFFIDAGPRYGKFGLTHRDLINEAIRYSTLDNCFRIWNGENIEKVARNQDEERVLSAMALCMLEQDINWGTRNWQKFTHFKNRGRDMIMGFLNHAFDIGIDTIPYWNYNRTTPTFGGSYKNYDENLKKYFNFSYNPQSVLSGNTLKEFNRKIQMKNTHPNY